MWETLESQVAFVITSAPPIYNLLLEEADTENLPFFCGGFSYSFGVIGQDIMDHMFLFY